VHRKVNELLKPIGYDMRKVNLHSANLFGEAKYETPVIAELDGNCTFPHCVGFFDCWIIDPSERWALKRTHRNLKQLCNGNFVGLKWAMAITKGSPSEKVQQLPREKAQQSKSKKQRRR
jgi:hypothetical protein